MNKNLLRGVSKIIRSRNFPKMVYSPISLRYFSSQSNNKVQRKFTYGQGGQFVIDLQNRTYSLSFQTIWQDHAELQYSGLTGDKNFFITEKGKEVKMDDLDLDKKQTEYVKIHSKIPQDYTIKAKINGSIHHLKNSVSSKTRSNPFQIEILGYKNTYQWLNIETEDMRIININGEVDIGSLTAKDALIQCQDFKSKKVLFSGEFKLSAKNKAEVRSVVAYKEALTMITASNQVYIESLSGKITTKDCKSLTIDRLLSVRDGIAIECDKIGRQIIVESGSGTIQCQRQSKDVLREKIKLGKMHKGRIDFQIYDNQNPAYSKVLITE